MEISLLTDLNARRLQSGVLQGCYWALTKCGSRLFLFCFSTILCWFYAVFALFHAVFMLVCTVFMLFYAVFFFFITKTELSSQVR